MLSVKYKLKCDTTVAKIWYTDNTRWLWGCETSGTLIHCCWECKRIQELWKTVWWFLTKLNIFLPHGTAIILLGIYPKELKIYVCTKAYTQMFIAALFIIAKFWKQSRYPSVGEWINKLWYIQTMEYYSVLKRSELSVHEKTWRNFKCILLSERGQSEELT